MADYKLKMTDQTLALIKDQVDCLFDFVSVVKTEIDGKSADDFSPEVELILANNINYASRMMSALGQYLRERQEDREALEEDGDDKEPWEKED